MYFSAEYSYTWKEKLFLCLYDECKNPQPGTALSYQLRRHLERQSKIHRREIASTVKDGCTPLFLACKNGHVEIAEYLITVCSVDVEQRSTYEIESNNDQYVTPLWCAAVSGHLPVMLCLIRYGADINAVSSTGSTPVRSACFLTHFDIVHCLVEHGADIQKGNHSRGTCLINSIQSTELCSYLLDHGADINARDIQDKTALHYAVQERRFDVTKLLLDRGADPHAKNQWKDDALQLACLKGTVDIFEHLISRVSYPPERLAEAHELLGSTLLDEFNDVEAALVHWNLALSIRNQYSPPLKKLSNVQLRPEYEFMKEFASEEDLGRISTDLDALWIQSLLICERILGPEHKNFLSRLLSRGAAYADALKYQKCIDLWKRNLEIRVQKDSVLCIDACLSSQGLVQLYVDFKCAKLPDPGNYFHGVPKFRDIAETFKLLSDQLPKCRDLLQIRPVHKKQQENFDKILKCITYLIYLLVSTNKTAEDQRTVMNLVSKLIQGNPRSVFHGDTLLHLAVSSLNTLKATDSADASQTISPTLQVIKLLLDCGAPINAMNQSHSSPLLIASNTYSFSGPTVEFLLESGAHLDQYNQKGESPKSLLLKNSTGILLMKYITLKCLAATAINRYRIPYKGYVPKTLEIFLEFHCPCLV